MKGMPSYIRNQKHQIFNKIWIWLQSQLTMLIFGVLAQPQV